ncbi:TauD/TfdA family dioxygenase [Phenylobacterium sp.]|uniref:TauD/TfdA dioxygenase family protein n=1 Tax=Phenylobacterium sp. TaxID=1871053 RepID=UPI0025E88DEA|nr:TauD/TfdA family dioxygenase [Phenylobacterium sp.]MBX3485428.1 TauD/TfdA family dioxygenase [Phenylobacterium sp.]
MSQAAEAAYRTITVKPQPSGFGAEIGGVDLAKPLPAGQLAEVKAAWARHSVLAFPDQPLSLHELEAFTLEIGPYGVDPFVAPMPGHPNVLEVRRDPNETLTPFGGAWHSDWSFQATPPAATILRSEVIPPVGGDTLFVDAAAAYEALDEATKAKLAPLKAVHSATRAYGPRSGYAKELDQRSMPIIVSADADKTFAHPLVRTHPVTGRKALFVSPVYTIGIEGMTPAEADPILAGLYKHMVQDRFIYRHKWRVGMVLMWDNRCTMHNAEGGYDGHLRVMHRTTVAGETPA